MASKDPIRRKYAELSYRARKQFNNLVNRVPSARSAMRYSPYDFRPLSELSAEEARNLPQLTAELERIVKSGQLSLQVHRRQMATALETLQRNNPGRFEYIDQSNIAEFFSFLDDARERGLAQQSHGGKGIYGYREVLEAVENARKRGLTDKEIKANIDYWSKQTTLETMEAAREGRNPVYKQLDLSIGSDSEYFKHK